MATSTENNKILTLLECAVAAARQPFPRSDRKIHKMEENSMSDSWEGFTSPNP